MSNTDEKKGLPVQEKALVIPNEDIKVNNTTDKSNLESCVIELADLSKLEYKKIMPTIAENFKIEQNFLDEMVKTAKNKSQNIVEELKPFDGAVDGADLASFISTIIDKYVVLSPEQNIAITLWIMSLHHMDSFKIFPKLSIISPQKRCGKSTVLDLVEAFGQKSLYVSNITSASIFRIIESCKPTLIIDEADTFMKDKNSDIGGIINSGHAKNRARVIRCDGNNHESKSFSTWSPMVLASIGNLQDTIMDRSIPIHLKRKLRHETRDRIPVSLADDNKTIREKLLRWQLDSITKTSDYIEPPRLNNDRMVDNWLPLFTIANILSDEWLNNCENAYQKLCTVNDTETIEILLLKDILNIFNNNERMHSGELVSKLIEIESSPWADLGYNTPLSTNKLAFMLKGFDIRSKNIRIGSTVKKGYEISQFKDTFERYLEPDTSPQTATTLQASGGTQTPIS